ncbi:MAG TPA: S1C family serine protease [Candidatus Acidoferrales bacterium]|nr:S1C family serine protease [Candidatus Acidoferrales bacterium]
MQRAWLPLGIGLLLSGVSPVYAQAPTHRPQPVAKPLTALSAKALVQRESPAIVTVFNVGTSGRPEAMGTGFIVRADGVVVTNFHVVRGATDAQVKLKTGEIYDRVTVFDYDERRDIAILKIRARELPTVQLGDSEKVVPGDKAFAIGNPEGFDYTVSDGLVSARRVINGTEKLQITVPISHGSSGGPLYNEFGEVIGITTEGIMEGAQLINFAVPVKYVESMLEGTPRNLTLAQMASETHTAPAPPPPPPAPAPSAPPNPPAGNTGSGGGTTYTEPTGHLTVTLPPGWRAEESKGALMSLTNGSSFVLLFSGTGDANSLFQQAMTRVKSQGQLTNLVAWSKYFESDEAASQIRAQTFTANLKDGPKVKLFLAGLHASNAAIFCIGIVNDASQSDLNETIKVFTSASWN